MPALRTTGSLTDNAMRKAYRAAGMVKKGEETSHLFGFRGIDRKAPGGTTPCFSSRYPRRSTDA
jgi:hypothetical protein